MLISGCHFGDCHYLEGNYKCAKRMFLVKNVLKNIGLNDKRLRMTFVSASEGAKWGMVMEDVVKTVKELGPSPLSEYQK
jgi:coenzyme F420-reducing hydrogenase delta subunit